MPIARRFCFVISYCVYIWSPGQTAPDFMVLVW